MKFGARLKHTEAAVLMGHAGSRLCAGVPVTASVARALRLLSQPPSPASCGVSCSSLRQCSSGYHRAIRTCQCPSILVNNPYVHPYCEFQTLHITPALWKGMGSSLVSNTISAKTLSQILLHQRRSFALLHYKLRLTILIFSVLVSISVKEKQYSAVTDYYS